MDLHRPDLDWVLLAKGMGVEAARAETAEEFRSNLPPPCKDMDRG